MFLIKEALLFWHRTEPTLVHKTSWSLKMKYILFQNFYAAWKYMDSRNRTSWVVKSKIILLKRILVLMKLNQIPHILSVIAIFAL